MGFAVTQHSTHKRTHNLTTTGRSSIHLFTSIIPCSCDLCFFLFTYVFYCILSYFINVCLCILLFSPRDFPSDSFKYYCRQLSDSLIFHCLTWFTWSPLWIHSDEPEPMSLTKWSGRRSQQRRWNFQKTKNPRVAFSSKRNRKTLACWSPALCDPKLLKPLRIISYTAVASVQQHFANRSCDDCYLTAAKRIL